MREPYEPVPGKAIEELAKQLRPAFEEAGSDVTLEQLVAMPAAQQLIAAWSVKHEAAALRAGGKVASWLLAALRRRGLGEGAD